MGGPTRLAESTVTVTLTTDSEEAAAKRPGLALPVGELLQRYTDIPSWDNCCMAARVGNTREVDYFLYSQDGTGKGVCTGSRSVRIEITPNKKPNWPVVYYETGKARTLRADEPPFAVDDVSASVSESSRSGQQVLERQIDLSLVPLRDPLAPNPQTGRVVAPHGLIGQSFDGDAIAVDGKKDCYRELWWRQTSFKSKEITTEAQGEGAIEGSADDYKIDDPFGHTFKYSRCSAFEAAPRSVSALSGAKRAAGSSAVWQASKAGILGDDLHQWEAESPAR
ncbi:hypothetical protein EMIHUDRAFT_205253 [Emiliania huxleyi CCMP1516]|uniref:Uncharacterized protein n=2 Tax=Emiliania huxleyi TaxID=2903 RepID=A0A0D3JUR2_EMIH1|nr:hypothetical protein EMIHUDRAFT_205253 [Emiliania huxleyi CCMP1516]EOD27247.1 hypothetical protein EMIHUDRAFT_205253 [Emiliania huxleyi CCMP1516]|eukprot:XP_005779676.1 hypothetical protein EMIHUDRAFT_205253 [Emiliania huxleyi CCMP1516]